MMQHRYDPPLRRHSFAKHLTSIATFRPSRVLGRSLSEDEGRSQSDQNLFGVMMGGSRTILLFNLITASF